MPRRCACARIRVQTCEHAVADLRMAWNWVGERFQCLSVLLEQPFKDTSWWEDPQRGWSPERASRLGASLPVAILAVLGRLRVCYDGTATEEMRQPRRGCTMTPSFNR